MLTSFITALLPVPLIYLIYFRHFRKHYHQESITPEYLVHLESLLYGAALALVIILLAPYINSFFPIPSPVIDALVKAALVEKLGAMAALILIVRGRRSMRLLDTVICGIMVGVGFSLVENVSMRRISDGPKYLSECSSRFRFTFPRAHSWRIFSG